MKNKPDNTAPPNPDAPYRKIFYGWWIVGACFFVGLYTHGAVSFGFTALFEPVQKEFGWSYAQISLAASLRGMESGILAPVMGLLVDRWGPRKLLAIGAFLFGLGLIVLMFVNSLAMLYAAFALISIGMASLGSTVLFAAVINWFRKRVSFALSIVTAGFAFGGLLVPLVTILIDTFGWRHAMLYMGVGTWVTCLPAALLVRHKPEQYGYKIDGEPITGHHGKAKAEATESAIPARRILMSSTFWHVAPALLYQTLVISAVNTHAMPYLTTISVPRTAASLVASAIPVMSMFGRLGFGWVGDRMDKRKVITIGFIMMGLGLLVYSLVGFSIWLLVPSVLLIGGGWGGSAVMRPAMLGEYFGRRSFGTVHGFTAGLMMAGQVAGAPIAGWVYDTWSAYQGIWLVLAVVSIPAILTIMRTPRFDRGNGSPGGQ